MDIFQKKPKKKVAREVKKVDKVIDGSNFGVDTSDLHERGSIQYREVIEKNKKVKNN